METPKITTRILGPKDENQLRVLLKEYVNTETLSKHMNFTSEDKKVFIETYLNIGLNGTSSGSFTQTGEMIGCCVGSLHSFVVDQAAYKRHGQTSPQFLAAARFDEYMEEGAVEFIGSEKYLLLEIGVAKPAYKKIGLIKANTLCLEKLALQLNCDALVTVLNGEYLTSSVIRQGFTVVKKIAYENYRDPVTSQAIFKDLAADNYKNCTLVVKLLKKNFNEQSKM